MGRPSKRGEIKPPIPNPVTRILSAQDTIVRLFMEAHEGRKPVSEEELNEWSVPEKVMRRLIDGSHPLGGRFQEQRD